MHNVLFYGNTIQDDAGAIYLDSSYDFFLVESFIQVKKIY